MIFHRVPHANGEVVRPLKDLASFAHVSAELEHSLQRISSFRIKRPAVVAGLVPATPSIKARKKQN
jgi:hypothetical protein